MLGGLPSPFNLFGLKCQAPSHLHIPELKSLPWTFSLSSVPSACTGVSLTNAQLSVQPGIWKEFKQSYGGISYGRFFSGSLPLICNWFDRPRFWHFQPKHSHTLFHTCCSDSGVSSGKKKKKKNMQKSMKPSELPFSQGQNALQFLPLFGCPAIFFLLNILSRMYNFISIIG